jgi:hypothetical protein
LSVDNPVDGFGINAALTPPGNPLTLKVTESVKPLDGVTLMPKSPEAPCVTI